MQCAYDARMDASDAVAMSVGENHRLLSMGIVSTWHLVLVGR